MTRIVPIERPLHPTDQLCFIHIMKTAGSTFTAIVDANFAVDQISPPPSFLPELYPETEALPPNAIREFLTRFRLIRGHITYAEIAPLLTNPVYLTLLRDPVERVISHYDFIRKGTTIPSRERFQEGHRIHKQAASGSLLEFVESPHPLVQASVINHQTRHLVPPDCNTSNPFDPTLLESAKANLDRFAFVGLTEQFQDSIFLLAYTFGWYPETTYQSLRVNPKRPKKADLSPETLAAIVERNQLDIALYNYIQERFEQQRSQMIDTLIATYPALSQSFDRSSPADLARLLQPHYEQRYPTTTPVRSLDLDFRQAISGAGWHRRNGDCNGLKPSGDVFRWTGPSPVSTLDLPLALDTDFTLKVHINNAASPEILASLRVDANEQPIALHPLVKLKQGAILQATIPKAVVAVDRPFTRLRFTVDRTIPLNILSGNETQTQSVGLCFKRIQLFPATAQPGSANYLYAFFPSDRAPWAEAARVLQQHVKPQDVVVAPSRFAELHPDCRSDTAAIDLASPPTWAVIQRGRLAEINPALVQWAVRQSPVFANESFVIFSSRTDIKPVQRSPHLLAFDQQLHQQGLVDASQRLVPTGKIRRWLSQLTR
ncbi:MAG: sulfotransferase family protein [Leptolyngbyaceae cyanobacterium SL_7_1]|nr:sulfotransferase family protein [Leptolyngbyaceae cyanobacterium SL_7_1]